MNSVPSAQRFALSVGGVGRIDAEGQRGGLEVGWWFTIQTEAAGEEAKPQVLVLPRQALADTTIKKIKA